MSTGYTERFIAAMDDDFNTPMALAEMQSLAREINTAKAAGDVVKGGAGRDGIVGAGQAHWLARARSGSVLRKQAVKQAQADAVGCTLKESW